MFIFFASQVMVGRPLHPPGTPLELVGVRCKFVQEVPYVMLKPDPDSKLRGNGRFHGFCVDLLDEISRILHFNYTIRTSTTPSRPQLHHQTGG